MNLQTALGDVAKRAYDLVVIPEERASIGGGIGGSGKGDAARGKRYRGSKGMLPMIIRLSFSSSCTATGRSVYE